MSKVYALIDCNSFYCSCEQLFRPDLAGKPVVVLSNNDGCAIARTPEAKALGIRMGEPEFKIRRDPVMRKAIIFSSNYALYGDISQRVQDVVCEFVDKVEVYSIDELFLELDGIPEADIDAFCRDLRAKVKQWVGIPTGVGVGRTKTLAKVANHLAKKRAEHEGVCVLLDAEECTKQLATVEVSDVWGIGRASTAKLQNLGVNTALDLRSLPAKQARQYGSVVAEKLIHELNGISCIPLEEIPPQRKGTAVTRSFGKPVTDYTELKEAIISYAARAGEKLRRHGVIAGHISVFIHTNKYRDTTQYYNRASALLEPMTNDTRQLIDASVKLLERIYKHGIEYGKAGVMLNDLRSEEERQETMFFEHKKKSAELMSALDAVNKKHGRNTLSFAGAGIQNKWSMRSNHKSPCYTTRIDEVLKVKTF